jgi:hypothetical protein
MDIAVKACMSMEVPDSAGSGIYDPVMPPRDSLQFLANRLPREN